jgi:CRP-like cAMP-binding protein
MTCCTHHQSCVRKVPIFENLDDTITSHIEHIIHQRQYKKDTHLFYQGDPSRALYIIHKGIIKIYKISEDGKEQTIRILFPGDFFGQSSLVAKQTHHVSAQVLDNTELCVIDQTDFQRAMNNHPELVLRMLTALNERLNETDEWMSTISLHEAERRLAKLILLFEKKLSTQGSEFQLPLAKKELAPLIGSTRETVSRKLSFLVNEGIIQMKGQRSIRIMDRDGLCVIAGE